MWYIQLYARPDQVTGTLHITATQAAGLNTACFADKVRLVSRVVTRIYDDALQPLGMTVSQLNVLVVTARFQPVVPARIAGWLHLERSTLSRNVRLLAKRGWLESIPARGRVRPLVLTAAGHAVVRRALPAWKRGQREARRRLGARAVREVGLAAGRIRSKAQGW